MNSIMAFAALATALAAAAPTALAAAAPMAADLPIAAGPPPGYCSVTPETPRVEEENTSGLNFVRYKVTLQCAAATAARKVSVTQEAYEQDNGKPGDTGGNDLIKRYTNPTISVGTAGGTYTRSFRWTVSTLDGTNDRWVELFQRTRFTVSAGGVSQTSGWVTSSVQDVLV